MRPAIEVVSDIDGALSDGEARYNSHRRENAADVIEADREAVRIAEREKIVGWLLGLHWTHSHALAAGFFAGAIADGAHDHD